MQRIADRYEVRALLGRGGTACVYRVTDLTTGRDLALKQLQSSEPHAERDMDHTRFEREFRTLAQLQHPTIIAVYDYGVPRDGPPYYTMELLDGCDMSARGLLPWRKVCGLSFDICSSLALLHSRRIVHRDVSPRNIRCTRDGKAKLMDFGAMAPMGESAREPLGTAAFTPPEAVQRSALDSSADLYALGATLYFALTGRLAYPARTLSELLSAWNTKPLAPSTWAPDLPKALDELCLALLSLEPALRPQTAYEVMQRLSACASLPPVESVAVPRAYLATPRLIGREAILSEAQHQLRCACAGHACGSLLRGAPGAGHSRMLDACVLEAQTLGASVARAAGSGTTRPFATAIALAQQLLEAQQTTPAPELGALDTRAFCELTTQQAELVAGCEQASERLRLQRTLVDLLAALGRRRPLLIVVDDAHHLDAASAAVLVSLLDAAEPCHVHLLLAAADAEGLEPTGPALRSLAQRCTQLRLAPLSQTQMHELVASLFGQVPNLRAVSEEIYELARGRPRAGMEIARHLMERGVITYQSGTWVLPSRLSADDLPASTEDAMRARVERLSPLARTLAQAQAVSLHGAVSHMELCTLCPKQSSAQVDQAVCELLEAGVLALTPTGREYALSSALWRSVLTRSLSAHALAERHRALAELHRGKSQLARIHHLFAGGLCEQGLDALLELHRQHDASYDPNRLLTANVAGLLPAYEQAIAAAAELKRPLREQNELKRWFMALSTTASETRDYTRTAASWLAQLEYDSGLDLWRRADAGGEPARRTMQALHAAHQRYDATAEHERAYRVDEALRRLVEYVVISISNACYRMEPQLLPPLPPLLAPFAGLNLAVDAIWQNAIATVESTCEGRLVEARARWCKVHATLTDVTNAELQHAEQIRSAIAYGICICDAALGVPVDDVWLCQLEDSPPHAVSAICLRKLRCLARGDWAEAEQLRKSAELASLRSPTKQMFASLLSVEASTYARASDLIGLKDTLGRIETLARAHPGWQTGYELTRARFDLVRGDALAALQRFDRCIESTERSAWPSPLQVWISAHAGRAEACLALGRAEAALPRARAALERLEARGATDLATDLIQAIALTEAELGAVRPALARIDALIEARRRLGVSGLVLGLAYETRARLALYAGDLPAFTAYAQRTAREYRHTTSSPLRVRYERLMSEASRRGAALRSKATHDRRAARG